MSTDPTVPLSEQSFTASTPDGSVFVRVAVRGHVLGVQLEPVVMRRPGHQIAERIMACADVAYLQGQVAVRSEWERANLSPESFEDMPTEQDLAAARERLRRL
ncbi:DUF2694 family protein [Mycobacterium branderi]|uniref:DUF2694 domain-containing protein n=1 Tax=Mycobacterium branderi TaxID=43348 RepID=A0A7I7WDI7_9MYCO|nr:DUF2694 family protein [Mycobacterium branderi]MCV7235283.1 DUF2694 family protein [Mycobacterium branderi]ORA29879.1 hypothetical protein BST20_27915 [Mycobacterium branderi]BBZ15057.1 hypothetical protein MBRA_52520 [Mycobacterium branderi]